MLITKEFLFDAAHKLTDYHGKCENLHGHTYKLHVTVEGKIKKNGLVVDFLEIKKIVNDKVLDKLDHSYLNDFFKNPSAENIAMWIWKQLMDMKKFDVKLYEIALWENPTSFVTYRGK